MWVQTSHKPTQPECYPLLSMIHLDLQPEVEAQLAAEAHARGLSLDQYVESIVTDHSREASGTDTFYSSDQKLSEQQLAENLRQGLAEIAEGRTRPAEEVFEELHHQYGIQG